MISLVLPTYNEAASIREVLQRASDALRATGEEFELIVVDDSSPDGTAELAETLVVELPVRVVRRPRRGGLALAVVDGWKVTRGDVLGVMDGDLQHPPEVLTRLVAALNNQKVDLAIASRSGGGGASADWSWSRRLSSWLARHLAACVLPWTLTDVRDPMSGMFLVRRRVLQGVRLEPAGYKILLEVLAKGAYEEFTEAPYRFEPRERGSSKLGTRQALEYGLHLASLARCTGQLQTWMRYAAVGFVGAAVNVGACVFLVRQAGWPAGLALAVAIQLALLSNFLWNTLLTFRGAPHGSGWQPRGIPAGLFRYERVCLPGAVLNASLTLLLHARGVALPLASTAGVMLGGAWNLFFNVPSIWRTWGPRSSRRAEAVQASEAVNHSAGADL
jgi:dolichol-phosphate mannosyltransferase